MRTNAVSPVLISAHGHPSYDVPVLTAGGALKGVRRRAPRSGPDVWPGSAGESDLNPAHPIRRNPALL